MSARTWWPPARLAGAASDEDAPPGPVALGELDGRPLAVSAESTHLAIRDLPSGKILRGPIEGHTAPVTALSVGTLEGRSAILSGDDEGVLRIFDLATGESIGEPMFEPDPDGLDPERVEATALWRHEDRPVAVSVGFGRGPLCVWDLTTGSPTEMGPDLSDELVFLAALGETRDRLLLATAGDTRTVRVWDAIDGQLLRGPFELNGDAEALFLETSMADKKVLVVEGHLGGQVQARCWGMRRGKELFPPIRCGRRSVSSVTFGALHHKRVVITGSDTGLDLWHTDGDKALTIDLGAKVAAVAWAVPSHVVASTTRGFVAERVAPERKPSAARGMGICISGGGHRAALFGLGALLYVVDAGLHTRVRSIASVSGGSMLNAFIAQECDFGSESCKEAFEAKARVFARHLVSRGTFSTRSAVGVVLLTLLPVLGLVFGWPWTVPVPYRVLAALAWGGLFLLRGHVLELVLGSRFYGSLLSRTPLGLGEDVERKTEHILCATDLASNEPFYFSTWNGGHLYTPARGWSHAGKLTLATAVRASAAIPGGFPPRRLRLVSYGPFTTRFAFNRTCEPRTAYLADGGVWNNLATDWMDSSFWLKRLRRVDREGSEAIKRETRPMPGGRAPEQLIVINSSYPRPARRGWLWTAPYAAEISVLSRASEILFHNTVGPRVDALRAQTRLRWLLKAAAPDLEERARREEERRRVEAAVVSIDERLHASDMIKKHQLGTGSPESPAALGPIRKRAIAALRLGGDTMLAGGKSIQPRDLATESSKIATTLERVETHEAALLIWHGYLSARAECHVALNAPPVPVPELDRFADLVGWRAGADGGRPKREG